VTHSRASSSGVLPIQALRELVHQGAIYSDPPIPERSFQPASLDLTVGDVAYRLQSSFLPGTEAVRQKLVRYQIDELDLSGKGSVLEQHRPYLIPLRENLRLPDDLRGRTNPKSSTGRLDVFTRVVTNHGKQFDEIARGYEGELFLEVVPMSFAVKVRAGQPLNQLRVIKGRGDPRLSHSELLELGRTDPIAFPGATSGATDTAQITDGLFLTVDLSGDGHRIAGYRAKKNAGLIELDKTNAYFIVDYWERVYAKDRRLILDPNAFYLLMSRERVRVPKRFAAEMEAYDPTSGELRTHYAGFFDPGFGDVLGDWPGTPAVLEVRAHDIPFALEHGQPVCKLTFERMTEPPAVAYGSQLGSRYQRQHLALSRQFRSDQSGRPKPRRSRRVDQDPLALVAGVGAPFHVQPLPLEPR
jgi:dCTP deaminase